jgi:hypothetical protein
LDGDVEVNDEIINMFLDHSCQRSKNPIICVSTFAPTRLRQSDDSPYLRPYSFLRFYGIPGNIINNTADMIMAIHTPGHWTGILIQPSFPRIILYDGMRGSCPGGSAEDILSSLIPWLEFLYSSVDIQPVTTWPIDTPSDSPSQVGGLGCGPNTLFYLYVWLKYGKLSTPRDWNPTTEWQQMRDFIGFQILTQGGTNPNPEWLVGGETFLPTPDSNAQITQHKTRRRHNDPSTALIMRNHRAPMPLPLRTPQAPERSDETDDVHHRPTEDHAVIVDCTDDIPPAVLTPCMTTHVVHDLTVNDMPVNDMHMNDMTEKTDEISPPAESGGNETAILLPVVDSSVLLGGLNPTGTPPFTV